MKTDLKEQIFENKSEEENIEVKMLIPNDSVASQVWHYFEKLYAPLLNQFRQNQFFGDEMATQRAAYISEILDIESVMRCWNMQELTSEILLRRMMIDVCEKEIKYLKGELNKYLKHKQQS